MQTHITRILCPTDFSPDATYAFEYAKDLAEDYEAELLLLHVVENIVIPSLPQAPVYVSTEAIQEASRKQLQEMAESLNGRARCLIRLGTPFREIVAAAEEEEADLIVMATHGHSGLTHLFLGSTAERTVRCADIPVLTVRHPDRRKA